MNDRQIKNMMDILANMYTDYYNAPENKEPVEMVEGGLDSLFANCEPSNWSKGVA